MIWRLENIWPLEPSSLMSNLRCLPTYDPFGRPILVIKAIPPDKDSDTKSQKHSIIKAFEQLRIYLKVLYDGTKDVREPTLQYMALLDLRQLSLQSIVRNSYVKGFFHSNVTIFQNVELFTWVLREVIPMFPGMIAGGEFLMLAPFHHLISLISTSSVYSELFLDSLRNMEHFQVHFSVAFHEET